MPRITAVLAWVSSRIFMRQMRDAEAGFPLQGTQSPGSSVILVSWFHRYKIRIKIEPRLRPRDYWKAAIFLWIVVGRGTS